MRRCSHDKRTNYLLALLSPPSLRSGAHLSEREKDEARRGHYQAVQQIYRGWALFGIIVFGALASTLRSRSTSAIIRRHCHRHWSRSSASSGTQSIFWTFTFP
jgi:hypothetical protein